MMSESPEPECGSAKLDVAGESSVISDQIEHDVQNLSTELSQEENSVQMLLFQLSKMDKKKSNLLTELQKLHQRIDTSNCSDTIKELTTKLQLLKALENEGSDSRFANGKESADLLSEQNLEKELSAINEGTLDPVNLAHSLTDSSHKLNLAKMELAAKLRVILSLKRQHDDIPAQTELIQYECRFSELYAQIQEKHSQTRKLYATYNALLEIRELMLKETSLLNSIHSQFQDAMSSTVGRSKLLDSMEVILKGTKQKLEQVQHTLLVEQKNCDSLRERYATAVSEQRHFSSLLKAFQEECTRNEKLRKLGSG